MTTQIDPFSLIAPEFRAAALEVAAMEADSPPATMESVPLMRASPFFGPRETLPDVPVYETLAPVGDRHPDVLLYVINARPGEERPAILHTHGGGHIAGIAQSDVPRLQGIARDLDCVVVTVDYRLSPEVTYAGSMEDNYAGLRWLNRHAEEVGVDVNRVALMGESAGGCHAAVLANLAHDRGEFPVAFQCLVYPMLDDRTGSSREAPSHIGWLAWDPAWNRIGWQCFLGVPPGGDDIPAVAVPARRTDLSGLPAAFIGTGGIDLFVEENIEYARRLINAGVPTELVVVAGAYHGFDIFAPGAAATQNFERAKMDALRRGLGISA